MKKTSKVWSGCGALALGLALPSSLSAQEGGWNTLFSVDLGLMFWTIMTFGFLLFVLGRYAWKPMLGALDARERGIQEAIDEANRQREEAQRLMAEHREQLADARRQAQQMMGEGREAADRLRKELEQKARDESASILEAARREIARERDAAVEAVRREAVDVALAAASRILAERLDGQRDRQLVESFIDQLARDGAEA
jgi:F-type H+-transporting ATPase subunit b